MIVFIRSTPAESDPRVTKEVRSLRTHGFKVTVLTWDREGLYSKPESSHSGVVSRFRLRAPYGRLVIVAYYPFFWLWVLSRLLKIRPTIIHACDLDTIFPALLYKFLERETKAIFDIFDSHALMIRSRSELLSNVILCLERFVAGKSDAVINVSKEQQALYDVARLKKSEIIANFPDPTYIPDLLSKKRNQFRKTFRIVFCGSVSRQRGIVEIAEATKDLDDIEFVVAGTIFDRKTFDETMRYPHVKYRGKLRFEESLELENSADVLPVLYDLNYYVEERESSSSFEGSNKLYEAAMLGVPVVTNVAGFLREANCGILVNYGNIPELREAFQYLRGHPEVRRRLGQNGKLAFEHKWNWGLMERKLLMLYCQVLGADDSTRKG